MGSVNPNRYPYPNPNNNPNANPTLTLIVTLTPNLPCLYPLTNPTPTITLAPTVTLTQTLTTTKTRGTTDGMFSLRQLVEKRLERQGHMALVFVDLEKDFATVPRKMAMATRRWMGAPESEVRMVEAIYENTTGRRRRSFDRCRASGRIARLIGGVE